MDARIEPTNECGSTPCTVSGHDSTVADSVTKPTRTMDGCSSVVTEVTDELTAWTEEPSSWSASSLSASVSSPFFSTRRTLSLRSIDENRQSPLSTPPTSRGRILGLGSGQKEERDDDNNNNNKDHGEQKAKHHHDQDKYRNIDNSKDEENTINRRTSRPTACMARKWIGPLPLTSSPSPSFPNNSETGNQTSSPAEEKHPDRPEVNQGANNEEEVARGGALGTDSHRWRNDDVLRLQADQKAITKEFRDLAVGMTGILQRYERRSHRVGRDQVSLCGSVITTTASSTSSTISSATTVSTPTAVAAAIALATTAPYKPPRQGRNRLATLDRASSCSALYATASSSTPAASGKNPSPPGASSNASLADESVDDKTKRVVSQVNRLARRQDVITDRLVRIAIQTLQRLERSEMERKDLQDKVQALEDYIASHRRSRPRPQQPLYQGRSRRQIHDSDDSSDSKRMGPPGFSGVIDIHQTVVDITRILEDYSSDEAQSVVTDMNDQGSVRFFM